MAVEAMMPVLVREGGTSKDPSRREASQKAGCVCCPNSTGKVKICQQIEMPPSFSRKISRFAFELYNAQFSCSKVINTVLQLIITAHEQERERA